MSFQFRWTIAHKVGSVVAVLISIILIVLFQSIFSLSAIEADLKEISEIDIPLTEISNEIEIAQLEQRILLDKIISGKIAQLPASIEEKESIVQWSLKIEGLFSKAVSIAHNAVLNTQKDDFVIIKNILVSLQQEHRLIDKNLAELLNQKEVNHQSSFIIQLLEKEEAFDTQAISLIHTIEKLTQKKANIALEHEEQFANIILSLGTIGALLGISLAVLIVIGIRNSISRLSKNINLVTDALQSDKDIPIDEVTQLKTSDELGELSNNLSTMIEKVSSDIGRREKQHQDLSHKATKDHLTGCFNRMKWDETRENEVAKCLTNETPLSLIFFDIDHFKRINDNFGHDVGDSTLIDVVAVIQKAIRTHDSLYRTGGEEFSILLPDTNIENATLLAERIREDIAQHAFQKVQKVTISLGVTTFQGQKDCATSFSKRADQALYLAKDSGRNNVQVM